MTGRSVAASSTLQALPPGRTRVVGLADGVGDDDGDGDLDVDCVPGIAAPPLLEVREALGFRPWFVWRDGGDERAG